MPGKVSPPYSKCSGNNSEFNGGYDNDSVLQVDASDYGGAYNSTMELAHPSWVKPKRGGKRISGVLSVRKSLTIMRSS